MMISVAGDTHMAILLWDLVISAAFVLLAVGILAYVLVNLLLAGIKKGAAIVSKYDQTLGRRIRSRRDATGYGRLAAHLSRNIFHKLSSSPWSNKRASKRHT
jgi:hypothetical protein